MVLTGSKDKKQDTDYYPNDFCAHVRSSYYLLENYHIRIKQPHLLDPTRD
jgi:hypothetical protein